MLHLAASGELQSPDRFRNQLQTDLWNNLLNESEGSNLQQIKDPETREEKRSELQTAAPLMFYELKPDISLFFILNQSNVPVSAQSGLFLSEL